MGCGKSKTSYGSEPSMYRRGDAIIGAGNPGALANLVDVAGSRKTRTKVEAVESIFRGRYDKSFLIDSVKTSP